MRNGRLSNLRAGVGKTYCEKALLRFHQPVGRFPEIEEDEPSYRLLVGDYAALAGGAS